MDYFQGVVTEFLRADRATFVNTEYLLQLDQGEQHLKGRHWFCDAVAVNHKAKRVDLCEITYSTTLQSLMERLQAWSTHWEAVVAAIHRDSHLQGNWEVRPHIFLPQVRLDTLNRKLSAIKHPAEGKAPMPKPEVTFLEDVAPWKYRSWNGKAYATAPSDA